MSWYALTHGFLESGERTNIWTPVRLAPQSLQPPRPVRSLGNSHRRRPLAVGLATRRTRGDGNRRTRRR